MALVTAVNFFDRLDLHLLERVRIWKTMYADRYEGLHYDVSSLGCKIRVGGYVRSKYLINRCFSQKEGAT